MADTNGIGMGGDGRGMGGDCVSLSHAGSRTRVSIRASPLPCTEDVTVYVRKYGRGERVSSAGIAPISGVMEQGEGGGGSDSVPASEAAAGSGGVTGSGAVEISGTVVAYGTGELHLELTTSAQWKATYSVFSYCHPSCHLVLQRMNISSLQACVRACMYVCLRACVRACVLACVDECVRAYVRTCVRACVCV